MVRSLYPADNSHRVSSGRVLARPAVIDREESLADHMLDFEVFPMVLTDRAPIVESSPTPTAFYASG